MAFVPVRLTAISCIPSTGACRVKVCCFKPGPVGGVALASTVDPPWVSKRRTVH
ncbi:MAG: hypothetical protein R2726_06975 [Acidimicrobiales bacterium]